MLSEIMSAWSVLHCGSHMQVGEGTYGDVYKARDRQGGQLLALKTFKPGKVCSHTPVHIVSRPGTGNKDSSWCSRSSSLARCAPALLHT